MSLYHLIEGLSASDLEDIGEQYASLGYTDLAAQFDELVEARARTENAVLDQQYRASADYEAMQAGARQDYLTEDLANALERRFPGIRTLQLTPATALRSAA